MPGVPGQGRFSLAAGRQGGLTCPTRGGLPQRAPEAGPRDPGGAAKRAAGEREGTVEERKPGGPTAAQRPLDALPPLTQSGLVGGLCEVARHDLTPSGRRSFPGRLSAHRFPRLALKDQGHMQGLWGEGSPRRTLRLQGFLPQLYRVRDVRECVGWAGRARLSFLIQHAVSLRSTNSQSAPQTDFCRFSCS